MTKINKEFVDKEAEVEAINARLHGNESALLELELHKVEGYFIPEGTQGSLATYPSGALVDPGPSPGQANGRTGRGAPTMTEKQIDAEIEQIGKRIKALRERRDSLK